MYGRVATEQAKTDALRESVRDVAFIHVMHAWFVRNGGGKATATLFTVRAIMELISDGWVNLARWDDNDGTVYIQISHEELLHTVKEYDEITFSSIQIFFLVPTEKGRDWVVRHNALLDELLSR